MGRIRFSIAHLLGVVFLVGVGIAGLRESTDAWDSGLFGLMLIVLLTSVLLAIHRTERARAYWLGFTLFGWVYLGATWIEPVQARLPTTKALTYLDSQLPGRETTGTIQFVFQAVGQPTNGSAPGVAFSPSGNTMAVTGQSASVRLWNATTGSLLTGANATSNNFLRIGHSLTALLLAFLGGTLSRLLFMNPRQSGRERDVTPSAPNPLSEADAH